MCRLRLSAAPFSAFLIALVGCASAPVDPAAETVATTGDPAAAEERATTAAREEKAPEKPAEPARDRTVRETMSDRLRPASSPSTEGRAGDSAATAKLVAQLNDATRELATLRASNARLRGERATSPEAARADPAEEKLGATMRSYSQFKQELTGFLVEIEKMRTENGAASAQLKDAAAQLKEARAAVGRLENEIRTEKAARGRAEEATAKLREQLRNIAQALASAGLKFDTFAAGADSAARLETSESRLRANDRAGAGSKHVVKEGETLEKIAERYYGDSGKWRTISDANRGRLRLDGKLDPGTELDIPRR